MSDTELSNQSTQLSAAHLGDDIPEARRDMVTPEPYPRSKFRYWGWGLLGLAIALLLGAMTNRGWVTPPTAFVPADAGLRTAFTWTQLPTGTLLGHFPYKEAPLNMLRPITPNGQIQLHQAAAAKYLEMAKAARSAKVELVPISGFRSLTDQDYLFFDLKAQQGTQTMQRAAINAPPGYSEHHTGYAIDIGDGTRPETNLELSFETTAAFRWLQANAVRFGYELSFPQNNPQGVDYEPWHWRFVGDRASLETFYKARISTLTASPSVSPQPSASPQP